MTRPRIPLCSSKKGSLLNICLYTFVHIVVMASFGLLVSSYSENTQQAMFVMWFFSVLFMLMRGIFTLTWAIFSYKKTN